MKQQWICTDDCPLCEGKGTVVVGLEGYVNHNLEQDVRDVVEPCERSTYAED